MAQLKDQQVKPEVAGSSPAKVIFLFNPNLFLIPSTVSLKPSFTVITNGVTQIN